MIEALVRELFAVQRENEPISPSSQPRKRFQFQTGVAQQRKKYSGVPQQRKKVRNLPHCNSHLKSTLDLHLPALNYGSTDFSTNLNWQEGGKIQSRFQKGQSITNTYLYLAIDTLSY